MARPTKLTEQTKGILLDSVSAGMPYELACQRAGICYTAFRTWVLKGEEGREPYAQFVKDLKQAEGDAVFMRLQHIEGAAIAGQWQASAWLLERRHPEYFGRRDRMQTELTGPEGAPVQIVIAPYEDEDGGSADRNPS